jgi:hypothetical protein
MALTYYCETGPGCSLWGAMLCNETFDVFISYGHQDQNWVHDLAENLHGVGLEVFLDIWEITPGDVVVHHLERGLLNSCNGVLVVSPASMAQPWVQQEYAVTVGRAVEGKQRLIPVLLGDVDVPPLALLRCDNPGQAEGQPPLDQIAKTSSSNATATRRLVGS